MSTRTDPLQGAPASPDRVAYATGVLLDASDFEAEQLYHRGRLARALAWLHGGGTVAGLRVDWERQPDGGERVTVRAGLAIDRVGRVIEVPRDACLRLDRWYAGQNPADLDAALDDAAGGVIADVFLRFVPCPRGLTPAFASGPFDATDAVQPSRLRDGHELKLYLRRERPAPFPVPEWEDFSAVPAGERAERMQDRMFALWSERESAWTRDGLAPLAEHLPNQDATSVFLARLVLPATRGDPGEAPARTADDVSIENRRRRFVYPPAALARALGL